jgi:hypothetical protein
MAKPLGTVEPGDGVDRTDQFKGKDLNHDTRLIAVALAFLLAWLTNRFLEKPIRRRATERMASALLVGAAVVAAVGGCAWILGNGRTTAQSGALSFTNEVREQFVGDKWSYQKNERCLQQYPIPNLADYAWWFCMKSKAEAPTLLLLGNSYANHLYPGFAQNDRLRHHTVLSIGTCDVGTHAGAAIDKRAPCSGENYTRQVAFIDQIVHREKSIRHVVLDGLATAPDTDYIDRVRQRINAIETAGAQVILFTPHIRCIVSARTVHMFPTACRCTVTRRISRSMDP